MRKRTRHFHHLAESELLKKPLRFANFMSPGHQNIGDLLKYRRKENTRVLVGTNDFPFPLIINAVLLNEDGTAPVVSKIIEVLRERVKLVKKDDKIVITGIEMKSTGPWVTNQFIEQSSFADLLFAVLFYDPLFNEKALTKIIRNISPALQRPVETEIATLFPEVTTECLQVMKTK